MEETPLVYKKDKRTKNLTLRDIHIGDWVQEWSPTAERYSPPRKVSCINYDGTVYLVSDDEHYCIPDETEIENVDALPIDKDVLIGFGFIFDKSTESYVYPSTHQITYDLEMKCARVGIFGPMFISYFHCLQDFIREIYKHINFEWKGVEK